MLSGILLSSSFGHMLVDSENKNVINLKKCTIGLSIIMDILLLAIFLFEVEIDKYKKLEQLKKLLDNNTISEEEYANEKNKILNS